MPAPAHGRRTSFRVAFDALEDANSSLPISRHRRPPKCVMSPRLVRSIRHLHSSSSRKPAGPRSSRRSTRLDPRSGWGSATSATLRSVMRSPPRSRAGSTSKVIADQADYCNKPDEQAELATLIGEGVSVHLSNSVFPQSFEKELVIDQRQVLIMTMCLIPTTFDGQPRLRDRPEQPGDHPRGDVGLRHRLGLFRATGRRDARVQPDARPACSQPDLGPDRRDRQALTVDPVGPPHRSTSRASCSAIPTSRAS